MRSQRAGGVSSGWRRWRMKVGLPRDTRPGVPRLGYIQKWSEVTLTSEYIQPALLGPEYSTVRSEVEAGGLREGGCMGVRNVFDLMHSHNKLYCRVACIARLTGSIYCLRYVCLSAFLPFLSSTSTWNYINSLTHSGLCVHTSEKILREAFMPICSYPRKATVAWKHA